MNTKKIAALLVENQKTIAVAESCSGGLIAHTLTNISGSSRYFIMGLTAYSNHTKTRLLRIPSSKIKRFGAVSKYVALAMAKNIRRLSHADIGIATTGIAGPNGGTKQKPVGTVYIALAHKHSMCVRRFSFHGSRLIIKRKTVASALALLQQCLKNQ